MKKLILASASPRRRELLTKAGFDFDVVVSEADENIKTEDAPLLVRELALTKASAVAKKTGKNCLVLGADTVVCIDGKILGKPTDWRDAKKMLLTLSGRKHQVYTGVCIIDTTNGRAICKSERTDIVFKNLTKRDIRSYIASREPMDKAGAYAIQGGAKKFVRARIGSLDNVIGLPVKLVKEIIEAEFSN